MLQSLEEFCERQTAQHFLYCPHVLMEESDLYSGSQQVWLLIQIGFHLCIISLMH